MEAAQQGGVCEAERRPGWYSDLGQGTITKMRNTLATTRATDK